MNTEGKSYEITNAPIAISLNQKEYPLRNFKGRLVLPMEVVHRVVAVGPVEARAVPGGEEVLVVAALEVPTDAEILILLDSIFCNSPFTDEG